MSRIDELIRQHCPDGVEYRRLDEMFVQFSGMTGVSNKWAETGNCEFIDYMNVYKNISVDTAALNFATVKKLNQNTLKIGDILFTSASEVPEECALAAEIESEIKDGVFLDDHLFALRAKPEHDGRIIQGYLKYAFRAEDFRAQVIRAVRGVTRFYVSKTAFMKLSIAIPPIEVQREIVRILDSVCELEANLQAELEAREKQYHSYRSELFNRACQDNCSWKTIKETCDLLSGYPFNSSKFAKEGIRLMRGINVKRGKLVFSDEIDRYWESDEGLEKFSLQSGDLIISMDGSLVGKSFGMVAESDLPLLLVQRVTRVRPFVDKLIGRFLYHWIANGALEEMTEAKKTAGAVPHISLKDIGSIPAPLLPIETQREIVEKLDAFEALNQSLRDEIAARHAQYEHYRDALLAFEKKGA